MGAQDQLPRDDDDLLKRVAALERTLGQVGGTTASAAELSARKIFTAANSLFSLVWTSSSTSVTDMGVGINFTLDRQRTVVAFASTKFIGTSYGLTFGAIINIVAGGSGVGGSNPQFTAPTVAGQFGNVNLPLTTTAAFVLPAGAQTVSMTGQGQSGGGTGSGALNGASLTVMVLGPA
jgi:hypothetical protein